MEYARAHYERNRDAYDSIRAQVLRTTSFFDYAPRSVQAELLDHGVTFALISAQTPVSIHEAGYENTLGLTDQSDIADGLLDAGVNYYKSKARYIHHNRTNVSYGEILDHYEAGDISAMHRAIADECLGVGLRKAAYAMAKVVTTDKMCVDTHIMQFAGIDEDEVYNGVVVDKYEQQCQMVLDQIDLDLEPFMQQWVAFDAQRETVTEHRAWFKSLPETIQYDSNEIQSRYRLTQ